MNEQETQTEETTSEEVVSSGGRTLDLDKPFLWRIFRRNEDYIDNRWHELDAIPSATEYWFGDVQALGTLGGSGEYMLIHDSRVTFMRIAQTEPRYEEIEEEA